MDDRICPGCAEHVERVEDWPEELRHAGDVNLPAFARALLKASTRPEGGSD